MVWRPREHTEARSPPLYACVVKLERLVYFNSIQERTMLRLLSASEAQRRCIRGIIGTFILRLFLVGF